MRSSEGPNENNKGADKIFDLAANSMEEWVSWSKILEYNRDDAVWGRTTYADFWNIIMSTTHRGYGHHSYMVKRWTDRNMTCIKFAPKGCIKRQRKSPYDLKFASEEWTPRPEQPASSQGGGSQYGRQGHAQGQHGRHP
eukprot:15683655-Heterocapsa_arctica.AAC.1